jgi:hypothetical protein
MGPPFAIFQKTSRTTTFKDPLKARLLLFDFFVQREAAC